MSNQNQGITLTAEQLQSILTSAVETAVREGRKPADPTPAQAAAEAQSQEMRKDRALIEMQKRAAQKLNQAMCDHSREDGTPACVVVYDHKGGIDFLICQTNQCIIRAGERPAGKAGQEVEMHIFDTQVFNRELRRASQKRPSMASFA